MAEATAANPGMERYDRYYNQVLAMLQNSAGPERTDSQLKNYLTQLIKPSYDRAIQQRQQQTGQANASIDADAASRGMGTSTWVTDAKARQQNSEAADVATLNSNYSSALSDALLNQINQRDQNRMNLASMANSITANMYDEFKKNDPANSHGSGGGGGIGGDGSGGGGGGGGDDKTDDKYGINPSENVLKHEAAHIVNQNNLKKETPKPTYSLGSFTPKSKNTQPAKKTTAGSVGMSGSSKRVRQTR